MTSLAKKILIVDDEPDIVVALAAMLQDAGYLVSTPRDDEQLESVLAREQPQLILLDMLLSGRDGREIVRQLKGQAATRDVPMPIRRRRGKRWRPARTTSWPSRSISTSSCKR
jgi:DNA-binding response OmpR family regulator